MGSTRATRLLVLLALAPACGWAQPASPIEEIYGVDLHHLQEPGAVELSFLSGAHAESALEVEYGIHEAWQIAAGWEEPGEDDAGGALSLGASRRFAAGSWAGALEIESAVGIGGGDEGRRLEHEARVGLARGFRDRLWIAAAAGVTTDGRVAELMPAAGLAVAVPWRALRLTAELAWEAGDEGGTALTPGILLHLPAGTELSLGVELDLAGERERRLLFQVTRALELGGEG